MKTFFPSAGKARSGAWGENKLTNLTPYHPYFSQVSKALNQHMSALEKAKTVFYYSYPTAPGFIHPFDIEEVKECVSVIPQSFIKGLRGIFMLPGSKKLLQIREICYGSYDEDEQVIFLFPFHESLRIGFKNKPKPSECMEYERHGAIWEKDPKGWDLRFNRKALKSFYLRDVLVHEIGHHVQLMAKLNHQDVEACERFAEWFAFEFGMRKPNTPPSEFAKVLQETIKNQPNQV